jgi:hypothetical protein
MSQPTTTKASSKESCRHVKRRGTVGLPSSEPESCGACTLAANLKFDKQSSQAQTESHINSTTLTGSYTGPVTNTTTPLPRTPAEWDELTNKSKKK